VKTQIWIAVSVYVLVVIVKWWISLRPRLRPRSCRAQSGMRAIHSLRPPPVDARWTTSDSASSREFIATV